MARRRAVCLLVGLTAALLCCWAGVAGAQQFQDVNPLLGLPGSVGVAWGDYDRDGDADLFLPASTGPQNDPLNHGPLLYRNDGGTSFVPVSQSVGLPSAPMEQDGAAWGDYDNDGDLDLLVGSGAGYPLLYRRDDTDFVEVGLAAGFHVSFSAGRSVNWCDYDADDRLDAFCSNIFGPGYLMRNNGDGTFTDVAEASGLWPCDKAVSASWGDFNNDGKPDLVLARAGEPTSLFRNNGDGTFTDVSTASGMSAFVDSYSAVWGDYDNDGWLDCYVTSGASLEPQTRRDALFHNNKNGTFTDVSSTAGMAADVSVGTGAAWADYDNDGWLDLFVSNLESGNRAFLYRNNGNGTFTDLAAVSGMTGSVPGQAAAWADINRNGLVDLFQAVAGPLGRLFRNTGGAGDWLRVVAQTSGTGDATSGEPVREAIGARVEVNLDNDDTFPAGTMTRVIDGGSGFCGQNEQVAQFGLGYDDPLGLVAARVTFPDGSVVVHRSVTRNQEITIRDVPPGRVEIFPDVPLDYWAYPPIAAVFTANVVQGFGDGTYRPAIAVNRAQMAIYVARAIAGGDEHVPTGVVTPTFPDVDEGDQIFPYVEYCVAQNVVQGYADGLYHPDRTVNRGQMAIFIARAMVTPSGDEAVPEPPAGEPTFPDVTAEGNPTFFKHVEFLAEAAVVEGFWDGKYHPERAVRRDQMAVYIARAFALPM